MCVLWVRYYRLGPVLVSDVLGWKSTDLRNIGGRDYYYFCFADVETEA